MSLTIIIPHHHNLFKLVKCLKSVSSQEFLPIVETLVIIDKNIKSHVRYKNFFSKKFDNLNISFFFNKNNQGASYSRNLGIKNSNNEYIAFLDSDDEWISNKLLIQYNTMIKNNIYFSHTSYLRVNNNNKIKKIYSGVETYNNFNILFKCSIATPTVIFKKEIFSNIFFDEKIDFMEDTDFWISCSNICNLKGINKFLTKVNVNESSSYMKIEKFNYAHNYIANKHIKNNLLIYLYKFFWKIKLKVKYVLK